MQISKITFVFPSRQRPAKFFGCIENIKKLSNSTNYEIICALDEDDKTMNNDEVKEKVKNYQNVKCYYGTSANKIAACNREIGKISEDTSIVCLHSDDMRFMVPGFDNEIRFAFKENFPEFDGAVHFPDQKTGNRTMTYTMIGIKLLKKLGYLYHPDFLSVYSDNHLTEMTRAMGKYVFIDKLILNHDHPIWGKVPWDEQYRKTESQEYYEKDRETYARLKANNFGL